MKRKIILPYSRKFLPVPTVISFFMVGLLALTGISCGESKVSSTQSVKNNASDNSTTFQTKQSDGSQDTTISGESSVQGEPDMEIIPTEGRIPKTFISSLPGDICGKYTPPSSEQNFILTDGIYTEGVPDEGTFFSITLQDTVVEGDLTGDGDNEQVVLIDCSAGNQPVTIAVIYTQLASPEILEVLNKPKNPSEDTSVNSAYFPRIEDGKLSIDWTNRTRRYVWKEVYTWKVDHFSYSSQYL